MLNSKRVRFVRFSKLLKVLENGKSLWKHGYEKFLESGLAVDITKTMLRKNMKLLQCAQIHMYKLDLSLLCEILKCCAVGKKYYFLDMEKIY